MTADGADHPVLLPQFSVTEPKIDKGVVVQVHEYGANLKLIESGASGYLHISRFEEGFTDPPLSNIVHEGDEYTVLVGHLNEKFGCYEVSRRAALRFQKFEKSGLVEGEKSAANIQRVSALGCSLLIEECSAYLPATSSHPWSQYRILFESGRLTEGQEIEVMIGRWNFRAESLSVRLPIPQLDIAAEEIQYGEVIFLRPQSIKKKKKLQNIVYAQLNQPDAIARADASTIVDVERVFPIGARIPLQPERVDPHTGLIVASIAWELTQVSIPPAPSVGQTYEGIVSVTAPFGAHCLVNDRTNVFMHKSSIIGEVSENLQKYLHPGDKVEVKIIDRDESRGPNYKGEFIRRIDQLFEPPSDDSALIDLASSRRKGSTGGFSRDATFRWRVLEAYDHYCCVCGQRYAVGEASAMEAAHVVPRSNRGSDVLENGLCLCPTHHWAFDKGFLTIAEDFCLLVAEIILTSGVDGHWLADLNGRPSQIGQDAPINSQALAWHRRNVFLD